MSVMDIAGQRVLCLGEVRGRLSTLNDLAAAHRATAIVCTGTFGFFDQESAGTMSAGQLRHAAQFSPLGLESMPSDKAELVAKVGAGLSELPLFIEKHVELAVPVYCVPGSGDDVRVVNKFSSGDYSVPNLHIINETSSFFLETPNQKARIHLFGLGGALRVDRLLDSGSSTTTQPGGPGETWIGLWQMARLVAHLHDVWRVDDVHMFVSHAAPVAQPLLQYYAALVRADLTISSSLHYRNIVSVVPAATDPVYDTWIAKLAAARAEVADAWTRAQPALAKTPEQLAALQPMVKLLTEQPGAVTSKFLRTAFRNQWHWNLCDTENGALVLAFNGDRLASETVSAGSCYGERHPVAVTKKKERPTRAERNVERAARAANGHGSPQASPSEPNGESAAEDKAAPHGALWFRDGQRAEDEILECLTPEDRANVTKVVFKDSSAQRSDGPRSKYCVVHFGTYEQATAAYERVDKDRAGSVAIHTNQPSRSRRKP